MTTPGVRHLTRIDEISIDEMHALFDAAEAHRRPRPTGSADPPHTADRILATLFFESSTRTRLSFEAAAHRLGVRVISVAQAAASSAAKGEMLIDTIRTVQRYADAIVLRHPAEGAAALAAKVAHVPVINAGDGAREHPTQTLIDLATIRQRFGTIQGLTIGLSGDLRFGRTAHSLAKAAARLGCSLICIAPEDLQLPGDLLERLGRETTIETATRLEEVIANLDVLYMTRLQMERMNPARHAGLAPPGGLNPAVLEAARPSLLVMHPLPRVDEIDPTVDEDPRAWYFEQVANGVVMRMAILEFLLSQATPLPLGALNAPLGVYDPPWRQQEGLAGQRCANESCVTNIERAVQGRSDDNEHCAYCDHPLSPS